MREIPSDACDYPNQAVLCYVQGVQAIGGTWVPNIIKELNTKVCYEEYMVDILGWFI